MGDDSVALKEVPSKSSVSKKEDRVLVEPLVSNATPNGEELVYVDRWAMRRLDRSRGKLELLMVYVRNEEARSHNHDYPSVFEQGFTDFCNLRV